LKYDVVVLTEPIAEGGMRLLRDEFREVRLASNLTETQLCETMSNAQAIVKRLTKVTRKMIESAQYLKVVVRHGVGVDNIDLEAATEHGIQVVYTPESLSVSVAEFTIGTILVLLKRIREADAAVRGGNWNAR
jgi:D-3-phosphoglycerate dehydrogenase